MTYVNFMLRFHKPVSFSLTFFLADLDHSESNLEADMFGCPGIGVGTTACPGPGTQVTGREDDHHTLVGDVTYGPFAFGHRELILGTVLVIAAVHLQP